MNAAADLGLTVVIPTFERPALLEKALRALFAERNVPVGWEILVVDDGSRDRTREVVESLRPESPVPLRYLFQENRGPAAARNLAIRQAAGVIILFLGDDIIVQPGLLREHVECHRQHPDPAVAVLGHVTWSPGVKITPFMRWFERSGEQFDFAAIQDQDDVDPGSYFYTSNLSLKRRFFEETRELFDESFRHAVLEDIDLGRRLARHGLRLEYRSAALAHHEHAMSLRSYVGRMELCGEYSRLLAAKDEAAPVAPPSGAAAPGRPRRGVSFWIEYPYYLFRIGLEAARTWPWYLVARYYERRAIAERAFAGVHQHAFSRGVLKLEARRIASKLRLR